MSPNRRIFLNVAATYGRSLFALVCGLLTGRWLLMSLGEVDYGLYGLVGGLTAFISFFNSFLSSAISRYYAFSVGESQVAGKEAEGLENCRRWFNTAVALHVTVPTILVAVGYPLGVLAVERWLTIPPDRVAACVSVFRCVCAMCFIGMLNVPFNAMYVAKQKIAELTVYSVFQTCCNVAVLAYMVSHPADWLARYARFLCLMMVIPQCLIMIRALRTFPECRLNWVYMRNVGRVLSLGRFAGWQFFGNLGALVRSQGMAILVNKMFGPSMNASMGVGGTVAGQTDQLSAALNGALSPAITNLAGAGQKERMLRMTSRSCKLGAVLCLLFVLPLSMEIRAVLDLWLVNPPPLAAEVCLLTLATVAVDETARGVGIAVTAYGRIALFYVLLGGLNVLSLPLAWAVVALGHCGFLSVLVVLLVARVVSVISSACLAEHVIGFSFRRWFSEVFCRVALVSALSLAVGFVVRFALRDFFYFRMLATFASVTALFVPLCWFVVLAKDERAAITVRIKGRLHL